MSLQDFTNKSAREPLGDINSPYAADHVDSMNSLDRSLEDNLSTSLQD